MQQNKCIFSLELPTNMMPLGMKVTLFIVVAFVCEENYTYKKKRKELTWLIYRYLTIEIQEFLYSCTFNPLKKISLGDLFE